MQKWVGRNGKFKHKLGANAACESDQREESKETETVAAVGMNWSKRVLGEK